MSLYYNKLPAAAAAAAAAVAGAAFPAAAAAAVTIRHAFPDDRLTLIRLAALDSAEVPSEPMVVAEVDGELLVALSLRDGAVIADPFHRTQALVELLRARAAQLKKAAAPARSPRPWTIATRGISRRRAFG